MKHLLDVNVLLAAIWTNHNHVAAYAAFWHPFRDAEAQCRWTGGLAPLRPPATIFHPSGMESAR
ncbi:MAG TPA: hypothetical protein VN829_00590 [Dongiaceae bacterium]|nr:hypothetical protein [Dongiaceae bacterium]